MSEDFVNLRKIFPHERKIFVLVLVSLFRVKNLPQLLPHPSQVERQFLPLHRPLQALLAAVALVLRLRLSQSLP